MAHRPDAVAWHDGPDAGARDRDPDAHLVETAGVADRTSAPGTTWRGLGRGPASLVVTVAPDLAATELLVTVDSLLAALPRAVVRLGDSHRALVGADPRVVPVEDRVPDTAQLHLVVRRGLTGDTAAWTALLWGSTATRPPGRWPTAARSCRTSGCSVAPPGGAARPRRRRSAARRRRCVRGPTTSPWRRGSAGGRGNDRRVGGE